MKSYWSGLLGVVTQLALATAIGFLGQRWIAHFDLRGPFLLASPLFALNIFVMFVGDRFSSVEESETPKSRDAKTIQEAALEFGFGRVMVGQRKGSSTPRIYLKLDENKRVDLDVNWLDFDKETQRYAVVWALAVDREKKSGKVLKGVPFYLLETMGMAVAGLNLWSILAFHSFCAGYGAFSMVYGRDRMMIRQDIAGFRIMKNLEAAISFVKQDSLGKTMMVSTEKRISALQREAARLSIAG